MLFFPLNSSESAHALAAACPRTRSSRWRQRMEMMMSPVRSRSRRHAVHSLQPTRTHSLYHTHLIRSLLILAISMTPSFARMIVSTDHLSLSHLTFFHPRTKLCSIYNWYCASHFISPFAPTHVFWENPQMHPLNHIKYPEAYLFWFYTLVYSFLFIVPLILVKIERKIAKIFIETIWILCSLL